MDSENGWVEYVVYDNMIIASAHCHKGKYTRDMFKAMKEVLAIKGEVYTELPFDYLVKFYSRHCIVELIEEDYYKIRSR